MNIFKKIYYFFNFKWCIADTEPFAMTFEAYLHKLKINYERKEN